jgi:hypothetical protein
MELQAKRKPCSWETEEEMVEANLIESKQVKMGIVCVADEKFAENSTTYV